MQGVFRRAVILQFNANREEFRLQLFVDRRPVQAVLARREHTLDDFDGLTSMS